MTDQVFNLEVGEPRIRLFEKKRPIDAVAELVWNSLDADANFIQIIIERTAMSAIEKIIVYDDGDGITPEQARESFREYGDTWKARRSLTARQKRIMHGSKGEGRLFALALGEIFEWDSVAEVDGSRFRTRVSASIARPTRWNISEPVETQDPTGTTVTIHVPQGKRLSSLEVQEARDTLTARLAYYLRGYPQIRVQYDGTVLNPEDVVQDVVDLDLILPEEYAHDSPRPIVTFVEWEERIRDRKMLVCSAEGIIRAEHGEAWNDPIVHFTPYLRSSRFDEANTADLHILPMMHALLLHSAEQAIRKHISKRHREISSQVVEQLKSEDLYPYDESSTDPTEIVERQTFDLVVTVARSALPKKGTPRRLSINLLQGALERNPSDLQDLLGRVLTLEPDERQLLSNLLKETELSAVIAATTTVTDRLKFIGGLRKILADREARESFREIDQLHPMVAANLWLFGEEWTLTRTEVGLTSVMASHLSLLGQDTVLESQLESVRQKDGRTGRVDILLFRGAGDEHQTERLIVELKRPTVKVGHGELEQIKSYARAIVDDPQFHGAACRWKFVLVTYDYDPRILRDIRQVDKPDGLADHQEEYKLWVHSWGEIFDAAERKLRFFQKQLRYDATDERITQHLHDVYAQFLPTSLRESRTNP